jgi:AAA family ATP:ADP antiporter
MRIVPRVRSILLRVTRARPDELGAALWAFVYFFALLAGYYVLRPIREEVSMEVGTAALQRLFLAVFLTMLAVVPVFGWLTRRFARRTWLPGVYLFFISNLVGFSLVLAAEGVQGARWGSVFYVWVNVFNLFVVSVFWSVMAETFDVEQARRLYGFIAAGGTAGALVGPLITSELVKLVGPTRLMLVSAGFLALAILAVGRLGAWRDRGGRHPALPSPAAAPTTVPAARPSDDFQASLWSGLADVVRSPYLLGICGFLLGYSLLSTFLYFETAELLPRHLGDPAARTQLLARLDLVVSVATLLLQVLAFQALVARLGTGLVLASMPLLSLAGFVVLGAYPHIAVLLGFGLARRAGEYALSKPARETLFNLLPLDQKYRAKNVIDTLVHRTGDTASAWAVSAMRAAGLEWMAITWLSVPIAGGWLGVSLWLGAAAEKKRRALRTAASLPEVPAA